MARMREFVKVVRARVVCNPLWEPKILCREMGIATQMMSCIIHNDLGLCVYKCYTYHPLNEELKEIWRVHSQNLLQEYDNESHHNILFTDEKIFTIEESFNKQNDSVCSIICGSPGKSTVHATRSPSISQYGLVCIREKVL